MKKLKLISAGLFLAASLAFLGMRLGFASVPAGTINRIENAVIWAGSPPVPVTSNTPLPVNASNSNNLIVSSTVPYSTDMTSGSLGALNAVFYGNIFGGTGTAQVRIQGTWSGTITFYKSILIANSSGSAYVLVPAEAYPVGGGLPVTSTTANGEWNIPLTGLSGRDSIELEMTSYTSGTAYTAFSPGGTTGIVQAVQPDGANLNVTPNLGNNPVSSTNPMPVKQVSSVNAPANPNEFYYSFYPTSSIAGMNACVVPTSGHTFYITHVDLEDIEAAGTTSFASAAIVGGVSGGTSTSIPMTAVNTTLSTLTAPAVNIYTAGPTNTTSSTILYLINSAPSTITSEVQRSISLSGTAELPIAAAVSGQGQEICFYSSIAGNNLTFTIEGYEQ